MFPDYVVLFDNLLLFLTAHSESFFYLSLFSVLILAGVGLPIPEEVTLLGSGFLAYGGYNNLLATLVVCFSGVVLGDFLVFSLGKKWGNDIIKLPFLVRFVSQKKIERVRFFFKRHGRKTVFIARFIFGFRLITFATAGTMKMRASHFIAVNMLAAMISVPLLIFIGYLFSANLTTMLMFLSNADGLLFTSFSFLLSIVFLYHFWRKKKQKM